jgi:hypothetical protein
MNANTDVQRLMKILQGPNDNNPELVQWLVKAKCDKYLDALMLFKDINDPRILRVEFDSTIRIHFKNTIVLSIYIKPRSIYECFDLATFAEDERWINGLYSKRYYEDRLTLAEVLQRVSHVAALKPPKPKILRKQYLFRKPK